MFPPGASARGAEVSAARHRETARAFYAPLTPVVLDLRRQGLSLRAIARELGRLGFKTRYEWDRWHATQVRRILARAARPARAAGE